MGGKLLLQNRLLPVEHVALGRLVSDISNPERSFHDPASEAPLPSTILTQYNVEEAAESQKDTERGIRLTELLKVYFDNKSRQNTAVSAVASNTYSLQQWDSIFKNVCSTSTARLWIENAIENDHSVYFIVGYRTFVDLAASESLNERKMKEVDVSLPASTIVQAYVPGLMLGNALDPGVSRASGSERGLVRRFEVPGEVVYALQFCKVEFKWFSSRKVESSSLGKTKWKVNWGVRNDDDTEEDDVLEVELEA